MGLYEGIPIENQARKLGLCQQPTLTQDQGLTILAGICLENTRSVDYCQILKNTIRERLNCLPQWYGKLTSLWNGLNPSRWR